mgnify:CR=1 FL=1
MRLRRTRGQIVTMMIVVTTVMSGAAPTKGQETITISSPAGDDHTLVHIPGGRFTMGLTEEQVQGLWEMDGAESEVYHGILEESAHDVFLDSYYMGQYEVAVAQWNAYAAVAGVDPRPGLDNYPATGISWHDADDYCSWAGMRLPTEAEWEMAARGSDGRLFPWGDAYDVDKANADSDADGFDKMSPVGSFPEGRSAHGLYDMGGNVWEYVSDWYGEGYYTAGPQFNPTGPETGQERLARGGSSVSGQLLMRATVRASGVPTSRAGAAGLRCAGDADAALQYPRIRSATLTPAAVGVGHPTEVSMDLQLERPLDESGLQTAIDWEVNADGNSSISLTPVGPGHYRGSVMMDYVSTGHFPTAVRVRNEEEESFVLTNLPLDVWPTEPIDIVADDLDSFWSVTEFGFETSTFAQTDVVGQGASAMSFTVTSRSGNWGLTFESADSIRTHGYTLRFAFHPGDAVLPSRGRFRVTSKGGQTVDLLARELVDLAKQEWQIVEIPTSDFVPAGEPLTTLLINGAMNGTFHLDDLRLVAPQLPSAPTVVMETKTASQPTYTVLLGSYPNPFNSSTVIHFSVPQESDVNLTLYDMIGQRVATLASGRRRAGSYLLHWDGTDDRGEGLASGTYFCRLQTEEGVRQHKILLLR